MQGIKSKSVLAWGGVFLSLISLSVANADSISLKSGEELGGAGSFIHVKDGQALLIGAQGEPKKFPLSDVVSMKLDGERNLELKNNDVLHAKNIALEEGKVGFVSDVLGQITVPLGTVVSISPPAPAAQEGKVAEAVKAPQQEQKAAEVVKKAEEKPPEKAPVAEKKPAKAPKKWNGKVQLGYASTSGRQDTQNVNLDVQAVRQAEKTRLTLRGAARYGFTDGEETINSQEASGKIDFFYSKRGYWYSNLGLFRDTINLIDLRITGGVGGGRKFVMTERISLDGEAGLTTIWEKYPPEAKEGEEDTEWHARIGGAFVWKLGKGAQFSEEVELLPALSSETGFRLRSDTRLSTGITKKLSLGTGFRVDYNHEPPGDVPTASTAATTGLVYTF